MVAIQRHEYGLHSGTDNEKRRQRRFQLSSSTVSSSHVIKQKHSSAIFFFALGAEGLSTPQIASEKETQKETLNVLLLHEMTRIRNVRRNSKHFPTNKVDFLTNTVDLRTKRTMTVSRNATNIVKIPQVKKQGTVDLATS